MKIGLFTDCHYSKADVLCGTRRPSLLLEKIRRAMDAFRSSGVQMCFCLGDLTDHAPGDSAQSVRACFEEAMALIRSYGIPFYLVPGNHDYLMMTAAELERGAGIPTPPYTVQTEQYRFVILDANYRSDMRRFDAAGVEWTDANLPPEQVAFLEKSLSGSDQPCVILIHENLDPYVDSQHIVKNAEQIRRVISDSGRVKLVLQGHYHPGAAHTIDGIPYITLDAMCEGTDNHYRIMEI